MINAVLFDFDGTVVDSLKHHLYAWKNAFIKTGTDLTDEEVIKNVFYNFQDNGEERYRIDERRLEIYYEHLEEAYKKLEKHNHVDEFLKEMEKNKKKMAIISFSESGRIRIHLKRLGIDKYFEFVLGGEDVKNKKPHPEIAQVSMERLRVNPGETLLIGDTNWDILTGKNAGTKTALFLPQSNIPFIDVEEYRKTNPDYEFSDFKEFLGRIKSLI